MQKKDFNWICAEPSQFESTIEWKLFIREYQSSVTDFIVSAINERYKNDKGTLD